MVNAYYIPWTNSFVTPGLMFGFPFYDETLDVAHAISVVGSGLGHEIAHGFDNNGAKYGHNGMVTEKGLWMPPSDADIRVSSLVSSRCSCSAMFLR